MQISLCYNISCVLRVLVREKGEDEFAFSNIYLLEIPKKKELLSIDLRDILKKKDLTLTVPSANFIEHRIPLK